MKETENEINIQIENLYSNVMMLIEGQYNIEGVLNPSNKSSTKIIFKDKKAAIRDVAQIIERFAKENNLDRNVVKERLLDIIKDRMKKNKPFKEEYMVAEKIISTDYDGEER